MKDHLEIYHDIARSYTAGTPYIFPWTLLGHPVMCEVVNSSTIHRALNPPPLVRDFDVFRISFPNRTSFEPIDLHVHTVDSHAGQNRVPVHNLQGALRDKLNESMMAHNEWSPIDPAKALRPLMHRLFDMPFYVQSYEEFMFDATFLTISIVPYFGEFDDA